MMITKLKKKKKHRNHPALTERNGKNTYFMHVLHSAQVDRNLNGMKRIASIPLIILYIPIILIAMYKAFIYAGCTIPVMRYRGFYGEIEERNSIEMIWKEIEYPWCSIQECDECKIGGCMELFDAFVNFFEFDRIAIPGTVGDYGRLLQGKRTYNNVKCEYATHFRKCDEVPACDHARLFKKQGTNRIVYVNQPYEFDQKELEHWCDKRDLIYVICDSKYSFYYPENTSMILIMSNDTYIDCLDIPGFPRRWEVSKNERATRDRNRTICCPDEAAECRGKF